MQIQLQPVTEEDREFLFELRRSTMREYVELTWNLWDEEWQRNDFNSKFNPAFQMVIYADAVPVGFLHTEWRPGELYLSDIQIHPAWQGKGIGTAVIQRILQEAKKRGCPVALQVLIKNVRARRLYERLGFRITGEEPPHILMRASA